MCRGRAPIASFRVGGPKHGAFLEPNLIEWLTVALGAPAESIND